VDAHKEVKELKKLANEKRVGIAKYVLGFRPKYPVIIVPGLASSALEAWFIDKSKQRRTRVWIDPLKIGNPASVEKISQRLFHQKQLRDRMKKLEKAGAYTVKELHELLHDKYS
tara:strand:- start:227 stop:568 length:342 start_codon:yes stop_codon:yes gene_type:complete